MARGIAFRLVENLGILERREVVEDVRGLDQEARAGLRRHGVRFGAHHIYIPALLKPGAEHAARAALGAEAQGSRRAGPRRAAGDLRLGPHVGRRRPELRSRRSTGASVSASTGSAPCASTSWSGWPTSSARRSPGIPARRASGPPGAVPEGRGFTVTPPMTSLLGASGDDFAVILKGLGYRMERRPKPKEEPSPREPAGRRRNRLALAEAEAECSRRRAAARRADSRAAAERGSLRWRNRRLSNRPARSLRSRSRRSSRLRRSPRRRSRRSRSRPCRSRWSTCRPSRSPRCPPHAEAAAPAGEPEMIEVWRPGFSRHRREDGRPRPPRQARARRPARPRRARCAHSASASGTAASARMPHRASMGSALRRRPRRSPSPPRPPSPPRKAGAASGAAARAPDRSRQPVCSACGTENPAGEEQSRMSGRLRRNA